jgi:hypothetical protein
MRAARGYYGGGAYTAKALCSAGMITSAVAPLGPPEMIAITKAASANLHKRVKQEMLL